MLLLPTPQHLERTPLSKCMLTCGCVATHAAQKAAQSHTPQHTLYAPRAIPLHCFSSPCYIKHDGCTHPNMQSNQQRAMEGSFETLIRCTSVVRHAHKHMHTDACQHTLPSEFVRAPRVKSTPSAVHHCYMTKWHAPPDIGDDFTGAWAHAECK